jgi:hypothetical protein
MAAREAGVADDKSYRHEPCSSRSTAALSPSANANEEQVMNRRPINDPYRNPFHNRFHVPVHSRLDEMQSYTNAVWNDKPSSDETESTQKSRIPALAGAFALVLIVAVSAVVLSRL